MLSLRSFMCPNLDCPLRSTCLILSPRRSRHAFRLLWRHRRRPVRLSAASTLSMPESNRSACLPACLPSCFAARMDGLVCMDDTDG